MRGIESNKGFTLIEIVVVIVILGVLAATAVPRFINLGSEARRSNVENFLGTMRSAVTMFESQALIQGISSNNGVVTTDHGNYQSWHGAPENKSEGSSPNPYFTETFINLGMPDSEDKNTSRRYATHGDVNVYEHNTVSRIGYGTGTLVAGECYAEYRHTGPAHFFTIDIDGC